VVSASPSTRRAFTLIELLVVIAVIAILAGLTLGVVSSVRFKARALDTSHRIEEVLKGLASYSQAEGSTALALQTACDLGGVGRYSSLAVITEVVKVGGAGRAAPPLLVRPDGSGVAWATTGTESAQQQPYWKTVFDVLPPESGTVDPAFYASSWPYRWPETDWMSGGTVPPVLRFPWGRPGLTLQGSPCDPAQAATAVVGKVIEWKNNAADLSGSNFTYGNRWQQNDLSDPSFYDTVQITNAWVTGDSAAAGGPLEFTTATGAQTSPTSSVTGHRSDGASAPRTPNQPLPFDLGYLSPLRTIELLTAAEVLGPTTGAADYRVDRKPSRLWNDAWGNPLLVAYALFQPERFHRTCDGDNRRDLLLKKALEAYGYNRAVYVAVGAIGPDTAALRAQLAALAASSTSTGDAPALAEMWKRVGGACDAATWTEAGFTAAPWRGVKSGKKNGMRAFLSTPLELR
jgi:prepilin-type N-terminal cleavage/methylation domain-containing protein